MNDPDHRWKYEYTKQVFSKIVEQTLAAKVPSYAVILELDRTVREKTLPPNLNVLPGPQDDTFSPSGYMQGRLLSQFRAISLMYIHRSFFAQALLDHPSNPLRSPYAPSFLAAYRCASSVIKASLTHFERLPDLCMRWWIVWTHLFSAAVSPHNEWPLLSLTRVTRLSWDLLQQGHRLRQWRQQLSLSLASLWICSRKRLRILRVHGMAS
jgi:hypothetical protein